jgi:hypothetical protein
MAADDRIKAAFEQLVSTMRQELEVRAGVLARELSASIEEERMAAEAEALSTLASELASAKSDADARAAEARDAGAAEARAAGAAELEKLQKELSSLRALLEQAQAELAAALAAAEDSRTELAAAQAATEESRNELASARAAAEGPRAEIETLRAAAEQARAELAAARTSDEDTRAELARLRAEAESARAEADRERRRAGEVAAESQQALGRAAAAEQALQVARDRATAAEALRAEPQPAAAIAERQGKLAELDRLAAAIRRIGAANTLTEVLSALADGVAPETTRTALLVAAGDGFQVFRMHGFATAPHGPLPRDAVRDLSRGLPFAPLPAERVGYAAQINIGGQTVAIVYGDDLQGGGEGPHTVPAAWPEVLEILARHAGLKLEMLTALRTVQALTGRGQSSPGAPVATMGAVAPAHGGTSSTEDDQSARRYARLLVSEIKLYNENAVRLGRDRRDLLARLRPEIERARRVYEERVPTTVLSRGAYFDDEIVQILADGDPGLLGQGGS